MGDLAVLGLRIESQEVEAANRRLDSFTTSADGAQRATDLLGAGSDKAHSAIAQLMASIDRTTKEMLELQRAQRLATGASADQTGATAALTKATADLNAEMAQASTSHLRFGSSFKTTQDGMGGAAAAAGNFGNAIEQADAHVAAYLASMASGDKTHKSAAKSQAEVTKGAKDLGAALGRMAGDAVTGRASLDGLATNGAKAASSLLQMGGRAALLGGAIGGLTGIVLIGAKAWLDYDRSTRIAENSLRGIGRQTGLSVRDFQQLAETAANASNMSNKQAEGIATAYIRSGIRTGPEIQRLTALTRDYAAATGQDLTAAQSDLTQAMSGSEQSLGAIEARLGTLDPATRAHIKTLRDQGLLTESNIILLEQLAGRVKGTADNVDVLAGAWRKAANAVSDYWKSFGKNVNLALGGGQPEERLGYLQSFNVGRFATPSPALDAEIARTQALVNQGAASRAAAAAEEERNRVMEEGRKAVESLLPWETARGDKLREIRQIQEAQRISGINTPEQAAALRAAQVQLKQIDELAARDGARKPRTDNSAANREASLARELEAMRLTAQANRDLAAAYGVSDEAGMRAAARAEIVGRAVKRQGDIESFVAAQLEVNASKATAEAAKTVADLAKTTEGRERLNAAVASGTMTAEQANEQLSLEAELRPLLAYAALNEVKDKKALQDQIEALTEARRRENAATREASIIQAQANNRDRLTVLQLERDLIGANNIERARQLAMLEEEIRLRNQYGKDFINSSKGQGLINDAGNNAAFGEQTQRDVARYNLALVEQLDLLRQIDDHTRSAAQGMADAFGSAGRAVGNLAASMTSYQSRLEEIRVAREQMAREVTLNSQREAMFARDAAQAQIQSYGDMMGAAKGFFREGSDGFKILQAAEQGYRIFQFAMALQSMALTGQETAFTVGQNLIRSASHGVVAVARALASLPFPLNLAAGAATVAALAAIGVKIAGKSGGGGGGGNNAVDESVSTAQGYAETADSDAMALTVASRTSKMLTATPTVTASYSLGTIC